MEFIITWLPSITTTSLLAVALWFSRNLIITRLTKSVEHEFNTKLESVRAEIREKEEQFKADLRSKEAEMATLRSGAITAMASRQVALDKRRLDAVDQLWSAYTALWPAKAISLLIASYDFDKAVEESAHNPKFREVFGTIGNIDDVKKIDYSGSTRARPFVSPMAWAIFSAYQAIVMQGVAKHQLIKLGLGRKFLDHDATSKLVKAALPHHEGYIDKYIDSYHYLLDELEAKLLDELQKMLAGVESDKASIEQAAVILDLSNKVSASSQLDSINLNADLQADALHAVNFS